MNSFEDIYESMNAFELAALLQRMISDDFVFDIEVDGVVKDIRRVEVTAGRITLYDN